MIDAIVRNTEGQFQATGDMATRFLQCGGDINGMRPYFNDKGQPSITVMKRVPGKPGLTPVMMPTANATLRKDEWKQLDEVLIKIAQERLGAVEDLKAAGLTFNINNGMGTTVLQYEDMSDITAAEVSMDGVSRSQGDRPEFDILSLPLPITHKDFSFNLRVLEASRQRGDTLDTTMVELATRQVLESIETMLVVGQSAFTFGGGTIRGYLDVTTRNTVTLPLAWDNASKTGALILTDVLNMQQALINANHFGPYMVYIPKAYETVMSKDYASGYPKSIRDRLMEIENLKGIKVLDKLTANNIVMVQMTSDVVQIVTGLGLTTVEWETNGGFRKHFKVMAIEVPRIRADQDGNSGVAHMS